MSNDREFFLNHLKSIVNSYKKEYDLEDEDLNKIKYVVSGLELNKREVEELVSLSKNDKFKDYFSKL